MHPQVQKFVEDFEREARRTNQLRNKLDEYGIIALEQILGPVLNYRFENLRAEYPFSDSKGGTRFIDFVYLLGSFGIVIEIDGYTTHARNISYLEFDDHLARQNDLVLSGWLVLRFSANQVKTEQNMVKDKIMQAIGHWWTRSFGGFSINQTDPWFMRERLVIELALRQDGYLRTKDVSKEFDISNRTALTWLSRFTEAGLLEPIRANVRITGYKLRGMESAS